MHLPSSRLRVRSWLFATALLAPLVASAGGVVGTGTPETCTESALNAALVGGGLVTFDCGAAPVAIPITTTKALEGSVEVEIDGDGLVQLVAASVAHFDVADTATATLREIELSGGSDPSAGGAITNAGALAIIDSRLQGNTAPGTGGAILNAGTLQVTRTSLLGNAAGSGGAIANVADGVLVIEDSELDGNSASVDGGALFTASSAPATIRRSLFRGNTAAVEGGAVAIGSSTSTVAIANSTLAQNAAPAGGAVHARAGLTVRSSTFSANAATTSGGAIARVAGLVRVGNSVLAGAVSFGGSEPIDECSGSVTSDGHNLVDDAGCGFAAAGDEENAAPLLAPLADNGGPTRTLLPEAASPAIDAGDPALCTGLLVDQRGEPRTQDGDGDGDAVCDVGAVEVPEPAAAAGALAAFAALASFSRRRPRS